MPPRDPGRNSRNHGAAIEFYADRRYFAVTEQQWPGTPDTISLVDDLDILWRLAAFMPPAKSNSSAGSTGSAGDTSRSATALKNGAALRRDGKTFEEMCEALRRDPETAAWVGEKGDVAGGRELKRIWDKAGYAGTTGAAAGAKQGEEIPLKNGADFTMQKINWLWKGWLARGKFHLLAGAKSAGKSTIAFDLMAAITSGGTWPDGSLAPLGDVLVWSGEDDIADTILPRFIAAGGDPKRIYFVRTVITNGIAHPFDPSSDMPALIEQARALPDLKLIMIDPVVLAIPSTADSHKNGETRRGLQPLVDFAEELHIALLGITHFTKGTSDQDPIERVTGSLAFAALARIVLGTSADEDGHQRRLVRIASNIGPSGGGIEYTLYQAPLPDHDFSAQRIAWGNILTGSPKDLLDGNRRSAQAEAASFLTEYLKDGELPAKDIKEAAEAHGHSWATVRRAQVKLGIKPRQAAKNKWLWQLPGEAAAPVTNGQIPTDHLTT